MTRHILVVESNALDGRDDEFNQWYDGEHLPAVLQVPGFVAARRFTATTGIHGEIPDHGYLAIYEIETDDLPGALAALSSAAKAMNLHPAFDRATHRTFAFTETFAAG
jgi:hypothetical protein